jgi:hypothetical protein
MSGDLTGQQIGPQRPIHWFRFLAKSITTRKLKCSEMVQYSV